MILSHPLFGEPIEFSENRHNVLVIENPRLLYQSVCELIDGKDFCRFILSSGEENISVLKHVEVVSDIFRFEINSKKVISKICSVLTEQSAGEEMYIKTEETCNLLFNYINELASGTELPLSFEKPSAEALIKACEVRIEEDGSSVEDKICNYIQIFGRLFNTVLFVFVNLKSAADEKAISKLYDFFEYEKVNVLLIEGNSMNEIHERETLKIIDNDLCEIT